MTNTTSHPDRPAEWTAGRYVPMAERDKATGELGPGEHSGGGELHTTAAEYARLYAVV